MASFDPFFFLAEAPALRFTLSFSHRKI